MPNEQFDTLVVGGGQAGIAMSEVARVTSAAADMSLTNELLETAQARALKDEQGTDRRFGVRRHIGTKPDMALALRY